MEFDQKQFTSQLSEAMWIELLFWRRRFSGKKLRGLAIDCHPWHPVLEFCALFETDEIPEEEYGKWCLADWKWFQFTATSTGRWPAVAGLAADMHRYYDSEEEKDRGQHASDIFMQCCANALKSPKVAEALEEYDLSSDFELHVAHPDDPTEKNYCDKSA